LTRKGGNKPSADNEARGKNWGTRLEGEGLKPRRDTNTPAGYDTRKTRQMNRKRQEFASAIVAWPGGRAWIGALRKKKKAPVSNLVQ